MFSLKGFPFISTSTDWLLRTFPLSQTSPILLLILANEEEKIMLAKDNQDDNKCPHCGNDLIALNQTNPISLIKAI